MLYLPDSIQSEAVATYREDYLADCNMAENVPSGGLYND